MSCQVKRATRSGRGIVAREGRLVKVKGGFLVAEIEDEAEGREKGNDTSADIMQLVDWAGRCVLDSRLTRYVGHLEGSSLFL
jgi:hypothetical protein